MKKRIERQIVFALIISLVALQPLEIMATESASGSDIARSAAEQEQENEGPEEPETGVSQNKPDETSVSEDEVVESGKEETVSDDKPVQPEPVLDEPGEAVSDNSEEAAGSTETVSDCFENNYTYDPENWYKGRIGCWEASLDNVKHEVCLRRGVDNENAADTRENIYIPAKTFINGTEYNTVLYLYDTVMGHTVGSVYGEFKHIYIQEGVIIKQNGNYDNYYGFNKCSKLETVDMTNVDLSGLESLRSFFEGCYYLKDIAFGKNTGNVTNMSYMFKGCSQLGKIDLSTWDTSSVTTMMEMFYGCVSLEKIDMSSWNTSKLQYMGRMFDAFYSNNALKTLCLPEGLDNFPDNNNNSDSYGISVIDYTYAYLPKDMFCNGVKYPKDTQITKTMSGLVLTEKDMSSYKPSMEENSTTWKCIWFGHYFQDVEAPYMDKDPIKWRILSFDEGTGGALLLSNYNLCNRQYHSSNNAVSWADSDIRAWLNSDGFYGFKRNAFSFEEQAAITESDIDGSKDKVFLLSFEDVNNESYGFNNRSLDHSNSNGQYTDEDWSKLAYDTAYCASGRGKNDPALWFLRDRHYIVQDSGDIFKWDNPNFTDIYSVRPAIRLNLYEHPDLWSDAGTVEMKDDKVSYWSEPGSKPASIAYDNSRWKFNNNNLTDAKRYGGFTGNLFYYINRNDYEHYIFGTRGSNDYENAPTETERHRFSRWYLDNVNTADTNLEDYDYVIKHFQPWDGSCYGMSLTEGLFLAGKYKPIGSYDSLGDVGSIGYYDGSVESEINNGHFMQAADIVVNSYKYVGGKYRDFKELISRAESISGKGQFLIWFSVPGASISGHVILCTGIEKCVVVSGNDTYRYRIKIYDPNSSVYDDDYCYIFVSGDGNTAYIPQYGFYSKKGEGANGEMFYYDLPLEKHAYFSEYAHPYKYIFSRMDEVGIKETAKSVTAEFKKGVLSAVSTKLDIWAQGLSGYAQGSDLGFQGANYILGDIDPDDEYSVKGGASDPLDATFELGDRSVTVVADKPGATAVFFDNGEAFVEGLNASAFAIEKIWNEDCAERPGQATRFVFLGKASGTVSYNKNENGTFDILHDTGTLSDISFVIGTTLNGRTEDYPDVKGRMTVSFNEGKIIVKGDKDGDGTLDEEKEFIDHIPVSSVAVTPSSCSIGVGETVTLSANVLPENTSDKKVFWYSENPAVATVSDGVVKGISKGTAVIRAAAGVGGKCGTCTVKVAGGADDLDDPDIPDNAPEGIWIKGLKASYPYIGSAIKPEFKVYRGRTRLYLNTDYTLQYKNNTRPGTAAVTIKMKGNYSGSKDVTFKIDPASLKTDVSADTVYVAYKKNKVQKPKPELFINGAKLKYGKNDLTFTYPSEATGTGRAYVDPGTYKIHIAAGNTSMFKDEMEVDLVFVDKLLMSAVSVKASRSSMPYNNGNAVSPVFTLTYKGMKLSEGTHYTVSYADDHTDIGKHKVTFIGNNKDYFGKKTVTFSITGKYDLTSGKAEVELNEADLNPDGSAPFTYGGAKPGAVVKYNGVKLLAGKDYTISYTNNKNLGTATAIIKGKGSYKGSVPKTFTVKARDINSISLNLSDVLYSAKKDAYKKTSVVFVDKNNKNQKLRLNTDYSLTFDGNYGSAPAAGTEIKVIIQGKGNYTGTINSSYRIIDKNYDFTKAKVVVNAGKAYDYTGSEIKPLQADLKVMLNNTALGSDDYEISGYYNNIKKGNSAYIKLRGKGKYAGVKIVKFKIGAAPIERLWSDTVLSLKSFFAW